MSVRIGLEQLNADARQHCETCEQCELLKDSWVMCGSDRVGFANGACPRGLWDHGRAPDRPRPMPRPQPFVEVCLGRHLEWPVKVWERIAACPLVGSKYRVPKVLYDEIKDEWISDG